MAVGGQRRRLRRLWLASQFLALLVISFGMGETLTRQSIILAVLFILVVLALVTWRMSPHYRLMVGIAAIALVGIGALDVSFPVSLVLAVMALFLLSFTVQTWLSPTMMALIFVSEVWSRHLALTSRLAASGEVLVMALSFGMLAQRHKQFERERRDLSSTSGELSQTLIQVEYLAFHDALTGLPNRRLLTRRLEESVERVEAWGGCLAVGFIDLDHFKAVNDRGGHALGDRVLKAVAATISRALHASDVLGRQGGDEFILILNSVFNEEEARGRFEEIRRLLDEELMIEGLTVRTTASFGLAFCPKDGTDPEELLRHADSALYQAKESGRNRIGVFTGGLDARPTQTFHFESALRNAIEASQFYLQYQPQVDILTGRVVGMEVSIRWRTDDRSLTYPDAFLPEAQNLGLIEEIDRWVMTRALQEVAVLPWWRQQTLTLAFHLSSASLQSPDFIPYLLQTIQAHAVAPERIEFEIVESAMSHEVAKGPLAHLRQSGFGVVIDDFGLGSTSLSYLRDSAATRLKIDRAFIADLPANDVIPRALVALAKSLRLDIVAEGVESREQAEHLLRLGCDVAQGFYYAPATDLADLQLKYDTHRANPA